MTEIIRIKPHHFLDIVRDFGAGAEFTPSPYGHAVHLMAEKVLADRRAMLELVSGIDDICEPCENHVDGHCTDTRLFERLGREEGGRTHEIPQASRQVFPRPAFHRLTLRS